jgi:ligand-binding sensor domain-containing protein/two-component sensor histidine kinase
LKGYYHSLHVPGKWRFTGCFRNDFSMSTLFNWLVPQASTEKKNIYFYMIDAQTNALLMKDGSSTQKFFLKRYNSDWMFPFVNRSFWCFTEDKKGMVFHMSDSIYYSDLYNMYPVVSFRQLKIAANNVNSLFCENDSTLWICTRDRGLLCIKHFLTPRMSVQSFFNKFFCTSIVKDQEHGYWVTTHGNGIFYLPNLCFYTLSAYPDLVTKNALCIRPVNKHEIGVGFADSDFITIGNDGLHGKRFPGWTQQHKNNRILDIWCTRQNEFLLGSDNGLYHFSPQKTRKLHNLSIKGLYVSGSTIFAGDNSAVVVLDEAGKSRRKLSESRITCITGLNRNIYWGTLHGVYTYADGVVRFLGDQYPALSGIINHLAIAPDSTLWISTQQGMAILKDTVLTLIKKEQGLLSNLCKHVSFEKNTVWIATDKGISRVDYQWLPPRLHYSISNITEEDGLIANDVNQTTPAGDYLWAATTDGIAFFAKDYTSHPVIHPLINISRIVANDQPLPVTDTVQVNYHTGKLLIELSGISYRSGKHMQYEYRLEGFSSAWNSTSGSRIEFPALPYGCFVFEVRAVDRWGKRSDRPQRITIINRPPFRETTGFLVLTYLALAVLISAGFYIFYRRRQYKKEQEYQLKKKVHNLEMMALRAQMNPHFIFNCLTSIQSHIMRADLKNANAFLHKFSILIRQTLQHSTNSTISLREEIKILELYLELEKLRLGDKMDYRITIADNLEQDDFFIPSMIVQPYIENAVKHGIAPLKHKGILTIEITQSDDYIDFVIGDNGPGIYSSTSSAYAYENDYTSMGTSITGNRINAINAIQQNKILCQVTDKGASGQTASGTIIRLSFPIIPT